MNPIRRIQAGLRLLEPRELRLRPAHCPFCGISLMLRLRSEETGLRCARCAAGAVHLSIGWALHEYLPVLSGCDVYEMSSRGPLVSWLRQQSRSLQVSEYFDNVTPGHYLNNVRCEDVQHLSFSDASFDLVTHTEVFEHVPDDHQGFTELFRVIRPGGMMLFTVPLAEQPATMERARLREGQLHHLLPPTYHTDLLRGEGRVLCFRDYGLDIVDRVRKAGFTGVRLLPPDRRIPWSYGRYVVCAEKSRS